MGFIIQYKNTLLDKAKNEINFPRIFEVRELQRITLINHTRITSQQRKFNLHSRRSYWIGNKEKRKNRLNKEEARANMVSSIWSQTNQ